MPESVRSKSKYFRRSQYGRETFTEKMVQNRSSDQNQEQCLKKNVSACVESLSFGRREWNVNQGVELTFD